MKGREELLPDSHRVAAWATRMFAADWPTVRFQPVLFLFSFISTLHVILTDNIPIGFDDALGGLSFTAWAVLGVTSPPLLLVAWLCIRFGTRYTRLLGFWARLVADAGMTTTIVTFLITFVTQRGLDNDYRLYGLFLFAAVTVFMVMMIGRDIWHLILINKVANRLANP